MLEQVDLTAVHPRQEIPIEVGLGPGRNVVPDAELPTQVDTIMVKVQRRRRRRKPPQPFDKRTGPGRRAAMLTAHFRQSLGPLADDPVTSAAITRAAETVALAEQARARALRADATVTLDDVVRLN